MLDIARILLPTDGSACAERARAWAEALAARYEAVLHIVHVAPVPRGEATYLLDDLHVTEAEIIGQLDQEAARHAPPPESVETSLHGTTVERTLLGYARRHDSDLIVMGTHGRVGLHRVVAGSVTERVVRAAPCPVLTVSPEAPDPPAELWTGLGSPRRLLVPYDFSAHSAVALQVAHRLAMAHEAPLDLVHVVEEGALQGLYGLPGLTSGVIRRRIEDTLVRVATEADVPVRQAHVHGGRVAAKVLEQAASEPTEVLVMATHSCNGVGRFLLGSVAGSVIRRAPCPVLVISPTAKSLLPLENRHVETTAL
ncbi:MAG: universal stress protein [Bacteroidota bacterium]